ncbi:hypothetical protein AOQ84DRAFT_298845, partial [Glonium stellatum]
LDVAVLNAGVYKIKYAESRYGWEETLQVNVLSTAFIGLLLLQQMKASKRGNSLPVLEIVSSGNHEDATISAERRGVGNLLQSYNASNHYNAKEQYRASKLFAMYIMKTLASLAKSSDVNSGKPDVLVTSVCPGACKSDLSREYNSFAANIAKTAISALFLRTTEQGSRTLVSGVTLGEQLRRRV